MTRARGFVLALIVFAVSSTAVAQNKSDDNDFHGFYLGGYIGATVGRSDASTTTAFSPTGYFASTSVDTINAVGAREIEPKGFTGGGTFGYNWQWDNVVAGIETDFGSMNLDDHVTSTGSYPCCAGTGFSFTQKVETDWVWTVRPRFGFTARKALIYGTAGLAATNLFYREDFTDTFAAGATASGRAEEMRTGWTVGGGVEFKTSQRWTLKGEYLYADFGEVGATSNNLTNGGTFTDTVFTHNADLRTHHFRFGVNFHF